LSAFNTYQVLQLFVHKETQRTGRLLWPISRKVLVTMSSPLLAFATSAAATGAGTGKYHRWQRTGYTANKQLRLATKVNSRSELSLQHTV
jgi:hypothetical protein